MDIKRINKTYPSLAVLLGFICGILGCYYYKLWGNALHVIIISCLCSVLVSSLVKRYAPFIFFFLGLLVSFYAFYLPSSHYHLLIANRCLGAQLEVVVIDPGCSRISWLPNPRLITAEVIMFRYTKRDSWRNATGKIALKFQKRMQYRLLYGHCYILSGYFQEPEESVFPGSFNFKNYLLSRGIKDIFMVSEVKEALEQSPTFPSQISSSNYSYKVMAYLLRVRDWIMEKTVSKITSSEYKSMIAALFFGCRQGVKWDTRQKFLRSGTIHLFAISGLHIGMIAMIFYFVFIWISFRFRHILLPVILLVYVSTIGFQPSAVRAFLMISMWSLHRAYLKKCNGLNIVFFSALTILLLKPLSLLDIGFQYSFTITGFLVYSWREVSLWTNLFTEKFRWMPVSYLSGIKIFKYLRARNIIKSIFATLIAFLAGSGITVFYRGISINSALFTNILLIPFIWITFVLIFVKTLFCFIPFVNSASALLITFFLKIVNSICSIAAVSDYISVPGHPGFWTLLIFYSALSIFIRAQSKRLFFISFFALCGVFMIWHIKIDTGKIEGLIFYGGNDRVPSVMFFSKGYHRSAIVYNVSSRETGRMIANYLHAQGIKDINILYIIAPYRDYCSGAWYLFRTCNVKKLIIPNNFKRSRYGREVISEAVKANTQITLINTIGRPYLPNNCSSELRFYTRRTRKNNAIVFASARDIKERGDSFATSRLCRFHSPSLCKSMDPKLLSRMSPDSSPNPDPAFEYQQTISVCSNSHQNCMKSGPIPNIPICLPLHRHKIEVFFIFRVDEGYTVDINIDNQYYKADLPPAKKHYIYPIPISSKTVSHIYPAIVTTDEETPCSSRSQ